MSAVRSDDCVKNEHGACKGFIKETVDSSAVTKMCGCPCHDTMYQLIRNTIAVVNSQRNNPYQFTADNDI